MDATDTTSFFRTPRYRFLPGKLLFSLFATLVFLTPGARAQEQISGWDKLKAAYAYEKPKDFAVTEKAEDDADALRLRLTFKNAKGETVTGLFLRPKAEGVYPVALLLHGLGSDKESMIAFFGRQLVKKGFACLALDAELHGERREAGKAPQDGPTFIQVMRTTIGDWRLGLDYLATRKDVDSKNIGLLGYSMGAMMGSILSGVDERIAEAALCVGGDPLRPLLATVPDDVRKQAEAAVPSLYVGHISPRPVFFVNAEGDRTMQREDAERLQKAAKEPKTILWVPGDHILAPEQAQKAIDWLVDRLMGKPEIKAKKKS